MSATRIRPKPDGSKVRVLEQPVSIVPPVHVAHCPFCGAETQSLISVKGAECFECGAGREE